MSHLLCFGFGFSARALGTQLRGDDWKISATSRDAAGVSRIEAWGARGLLCDEHLTLPTDVTHILVSAPPDDRGDPILRMFGAQLPALTSCIWAGYLSTTGVYGDRNGDWVDEDSSLSPTTQRGRRRCDAEAGWQKAGLPVHLFRLAGIYGSGRNQLVSLQQGKAQRIIKQGQVFSRIHVDDVAGVLQASMTRPNPGRAYNVCDDEPCPPQDVVAYAADLLGVPPPPEIAFEDAKLSPMAESFFAESKRVANARIKSELGYRLKYPNYRAGLSALLHEL